MLLKKYHPGILISCAVLFLVIKSGAQFREPGVIKDVYNHAEFTATLGANNFLGDLGGNLGRGTHFLKDYTWKSIRPLAGLSLAYYPQNWYQLKVGFNFTTVDGADSLIHPTSDLARWRIYRNLSFKSHIFEAYVKGEFYPLIFFNSGYTVRKIDPFVDLGVGVFHFNPQAELNGQWYYLQPLHLEGEGFAEYPGRKNYKLTKIYLPFSVGVKYFINDDISFSSGVEFRKSFTDYIDDVSTTYIDPKLFDKYLTPDEAAIAKQLYSRSLRPEKVKPGIIRGFSNHNDTYITGFISISILLHKRVPFYYGGM